jgi:hypothetical protein
MTSQRQAEANRENAKKSTGPRTPAGKAVVALNGMKHGLLSRESLVKGESEVDLVAFGKRLRIQLAPVGELELLLVDRLISTAWRLRRLVAVETLLFDREAKPDHAFNNYGREKMSVLSRYEVTLERSFYKALTSCSGSKPRETGKPSRSRKWWTWRSLSPVRTKRTIWLCLAKTRQLPVRTTTKGTDTVV